MVIDFKGENEISTGRHMHGESNCAIGLTLKVQFRVTAILKSYISCKRAKLGHMLLLNINRKTYG